MLLRHYSVVTLIVFVCANASLQAQMQPFARFEGELVPIIGYSDDHLTVVKDGDKRFAWDMTCQIRPADSFADGMVEVKDVEIDLDPLRNATPAEKAKPTAIRFRYRANLVADRSLSHCYAVLTFLTEGSVGTKLVSVGSLGTNKHSIEVKLPTQVDSVCSLHVFTNGREVRSNQHPVAYDVMAYYADFAKKTPGISAAELLKSAELYDHVLSNDGRLLAALRLRDAKQNLIVYDLESMKLLSETTVAEYGRRVNSITWVSDHELVYVAAERHRNREWEDDFNLHLLDVSTGKDKVLADKVYRVMAAPYANPDTLVLFHGYFTDKYNIRTGKSSEVNELEEGYFLFDRDGNDRVMIRYDEDKVTYFYRPTIGARWRELDEVVKQPGLHFNSKGGQFLDRVADIHSVGPDGDTLYISTRLAGSDRFELDAFSMSEGVIKQTIAKHPKYDLTTEDDGIAHLLFAKKSPQLLGLVYQAQKPQVVWLDPRYAAVQKSMDATFPDHFNWPIDWSRDGKTFVFFSSSEKDPGTYYVFKPEDSRLIPLLELGDRLKDKTLAKTEAIEFESRDGQKIPAYLTKPSVSVEGVPPLIVYVHGGPMARDGWTFDPTVQFFASRGYAILQVNYRGSSGYGAAFQSAGLKARFDTVVLDDIADGVKYLIARKEVDANRIAIMGGSFGGWATYMSLIKYPELYRAGIAIAAISNWRKFIRDDRWEFDNKYAFTFWKTLLNRESFASDEKFIDPYLRASELKQPVFIIHGERDTTVSSMEAQMMLDALKKTNSNVQSRAFANSSHRYWPFEDRVVMLNESARFLEKWLGNPQAASVGVAGK